MGHEAQEIYWNRENEEVQNEVASPWRTAKSWGKLLGVICSSGHGDHHTTYPKHDPEAGQEVHTIGLFPCLSSCKCRGHHIHEAAKRIQTISLTRKTHILQILKNIYGLKQAGGMLNKHLHQGLTEL